MEPIHQCKFCKEMIIVEGKDPNFSALVHLAEVHGVIAPEVEMELTPEQQVYEKKLTKYLESIKGSKINN